MNAEKIAAQMEIARKEGNVDAMLMLKRRQERAQQRIGREIAAIESQIKNLR